MEEEELRGRLSSSAAPSLPDHDDEDKASEETEDVLVSRG